MTFDEFEGGLLGIYAYDTGSVDSGIHDERLREKLKAELHADHGIRWLSLVARGMLTDESLAQSYTLEDVGSLISWLSDRMDYDL